VGQQQQQSPVPNQNAAPQEHPTMQQQQRRPVPGQVTIPQQHPTMQQQQESILLMMQPILGQQEQLLISNQVVPTQQNPIKKQQQEPITSSSVPSMMQQVPGQQQQQRPVPYKEVSSQKDSTIQQQQQQQPMTASHLGNGSSPFDAFDALADSTLVTQSIDQYNAATDSNDPAPNHASRTESEQEKAPLTTNRPIQSTPTTKNLVVTEEIQKVPSAATPPNAATIQRPVMTPPPPPVSNEATQKAFSSIDPFDAFDVLVESKSEDMQLSGSFNPINLPSAVTIETIIPEVGTSNRPKVKDLLSTEPQKEFNHLSTFASREESNTVVVEEGNLIHFEQHNKTNIQMSVGQQPEDGSNLFAASWQPQVQRQQVYPNPPINVSVLPELTHLQQQQQPLVQVLSSVPPSSTASPTTVSSSFEQQHQPREEDDDFGFQVMGGTPSNISRSLATATNSPWLTKEESALTSPATDDQEEGQPTMRRKFKKKKSLRKTKGGDTLQKRQTNQHLSDRIADDINKNGIDSEIENEFGSAEFVPLRGSLDIPGADEIEGDTNLMKKGPTDDAEISDHSSDTGSSDENEDCAVYAFGFEVMGGSSTDNAWKSTGDNTLESHLKPKKNSKKKTGMQKRKPRTSNVNSQGSASTIKQKTRLSSYTNEETSVSKATDKKMRKRTSRKVDGGEISGSNTQTGTKRKSKVPTRRRLEESSISLGNSEPKQRSSRRSIEVNDSKTTSKKGKNSQNKETGSARATVRPNASKRLFDKGNSSPSHGKTKLRQAKNISHLDSFKNNKEMDSAKPTLRRTSIKKYSKQESSSPTNGKTKERRPKNSIHQDFFKNNVISEGEKRESASNKTNKKPLVQSVLKKVGFLPPPSK
jgi:hypothetical protein